MSRIPLLVSCLFFCPNVSQAQPPRVNVISIVTDDQGQWALGCYGNKECKTPAMDRIAREGARFTQAFVPTPVCSPSRASFLTSLYGTQVGITDYLAPLENNAGMGLDSRFATWPRTLHDAGYRTAIIGKWHLGTQARYHPRQNGFDHFFGFLGGGNKPMQPTLEEEGKEREFEGSLPDILVDNAIGFVEKNREKPFAMLLHFRAPHLPYGPVPKEDTDPFAALDPTIPDVAGLDRKQVKDFTRAYFASIHSVDRNMQRLLQKLDDWNLTERTVVMFCSDHGYNLGHHGIHTKGNGFSMAGGINGPKRPNMWDTSIKIPLLVRWPGVVKPGTVIDEMVSTLDVFPSILAMAGVSVPATAAVQGKDFTPLLRGEHPAWRDTIYGQYNLHNSGLAYMRMIRTKDMKLVRHLRCNLMDELYDLAKDPGETRNLYANANQRARRDKLQEQLTAWQKSIGDPLASE